MTLLLRKAFAKASSLSRSAQEQLAQQLLEEIGAEGKWDRALAGSQELLEKLAAKARRAKRSGKTIAKGFDQL